MRENQAKKKIPKPLESVLVARVSCDVRHCVMEAKDLKMETLMRTVERTDTLTAIFEIDNAVKLSAEEFQVRPTDHNKTPRVTQYKITNIHV